MNDVEESGISARQVKKTGTQALIADGLHTETCLTFTWSRRS